MPDVEITIDAIPRSRETSSPVASRKRSAVANCCSSGANCPIVTYLAARERIDTGGDVGFYHVICSERDALLIEAPPHTWVPWAHPNLWRFADSDAALVAMLECEVNAGHGMDRAILEWVPGRSLHELLRVGLLSPNEMLLVARGAARGLAVLSRGALIGSERVPLTHGALRPRWLRVDPAGNVRLAGAGLGTLKPEHDPGRSIEQLPFLPPESLAYGGEPGEAADVFALGALCHYCVVGHGLYGSDGPLEQIRAMEHDRKQMADLPAELAEIVLACTDTHDSRPGAVDAYCMIERACSQINTDAAIRSLAQRVSLQAASAESHG